MSSLRRNEFTGEGGQSRLSRALVPLTLSLLSPVVLGLAAGCGNEQAQPHAPGASGGSTSDPGPGLGGQAGSSGDHEGPFDASQLRIDADGVGSLCRLSPDGLSLLVRLVNESELAAPEVTVEVRTGDAVAVRATASSLGAGHAVDLRFDRAALAGFVDNWEFSVLLDPDDEHGVRSDALQGTCDSHRARARAGMKKMMEWYDEESGLFGGNEWWRGANMLEVSIDYSRELGDGAYIWTIDNTFEKNRSGNFLNEFYDDEGWWALAWVKAYDLTHNQKYLDMAKTIFEDMASGWDDLCGGGIPWKKSPIWKNAIPNELFLTLAARLHLRTPGDEGSGSYLDWAQREWEWFQASGMIQDDYRIVDGLNAETCVPEGHVYTYNQGVILGGLTELYRATGDESLLDVAVNIARSAFQHSATSDGIFIEAVCDPNCGEGDGVIFKGIFARNVAELFKERPLPELRNFLIRQSDAIWTLNRNFHNQFGQRWAGPFDKADVGRQSSALDPIIGAVRVAEPNVALQKKADGSAPCNESQAAAHAFDGNANQSKWCAGGSSGQWLEVDLGEELLVTGFRLQHASAGGENPGWNTRAFRIELSQDAETWSPVVQVEDNEEGVTVHPIPGQRARYARVLIDQAHTSMDSPAARVYEFEVFGTGL